MATLNRIIVLNALIKHETLTIDDFAKEDNLGASPSGKRLQLLVDELVQSGHIQILDGTTPCTYTITDKGIIEGAKLIQE
jgi:predicted transcriptional regulator